MYKLSCIAIKRYNIWPKSPIKKEENKTKKNKRPPPEVKMD